MKIEEREFSLKSGIAVRLGSAVASDAEKLKSHRETTARESHFMARDVDIDGEMSVEKIAENLERAEKSDVDFMVTAFFDGNVVGDLGVTRLRELSKFRHRAYMGISIQEKFANSGLGIKMVNIAIEQARKNGFLQLELGVFSDNERAIHFYKKAGFVECGRTPRAFRLADGTFRDEIQMIKMLDKE